MARVPDRSAFLSALFTLVATPWPARDCRVDLDHRDDHPVFQRAGLHGHLSGQASVPETSFVTMSVLALSRHCLDLRFTFVYLMSVV